VKEIASMLNYPRILISPCVAAQRRKATDNF
jgi:hypothetical protein